jgi:SAM-dependent methyltransferase
MASREQLLQRLDSFAAEILRLYPLPRIDYRGRSVDAQSVRNYLRHEKYRLAEIVEWLPPPSRPGGRLLDLGTAYGFLTALFRLETQWPCEGLELAENIPIYCAFAKEHEIPLHAGQLGVKPLPFPDRSFDAVVFSEVLEHLRLSPSLIFRELHRILAPNGWLILTTPNVARLTNVAKLLMGRNVYEMFPDNLESDNITDQLTHIREYTMKELVELLERHGFAIQEARYSACMEREETHRWITALVPPWRGSLMILARKAT